MIEEAFGFAQGVTGGPAKPTRQVKNAAELRTALEALTADGPPATIDVVRNPSNENAFDFGSGKGATQTVAITARNLTISSSNGAVLKNVRLSIGVDVSDNILITGLSFHSAGAADGARDSIDLDSVGGKKARDVCRVRISHCAFDGYYDINICSKTAPNGPRLLVTIDHCLFFDAKPGLLGPKDKDDEPAGYKDRGAINFATDKDKKIKTGNAFITVANNVFIDVWRRLPRVARSNRGHVFNNLLYRWGYTDPKSPDRTKPNGTWRGMEVGGGENANPEDDGVVLIQANRFIPWADKTDIEPEIKIHPNTTADLEGAPPLPNQFDTPQAKPVTKGKVPEGPKKQQGTIDVTTFYDKLDLDLKAPAVVKAADVAWAGLVRAAGPPNFATAGGDPRAELLALLQKAGSAQ